MHDEIVFAAVGILAIGVATQWLGWRLRVPAIVFLLAAGLILGPITEVLQPDEILGDLLFPTVSMAVAIILFEGAMGLGIRGIRDAGPTVLQLLTVGAGITLVSTALLARAIFDVDWGLAWLLSGVLIVTGPTVIGPLVRAIGLRGRVARILEAEGTLIDPLGAIVAVLFFESFFEEDVTGPWPVELALTLGIGIGLGLLGALLVVWAFSRYLVPEQLHNVMTLAVVLSVFATADRLQPEAGLVGVTVMGVAIASQDRVDVEHVLEFNETLRTLFISGLFILLGARIAPDTLAGLGWKNLLFLVALVVLVRPLATLASTVRSGLSGREKAFIALTAPRGIVAASVASIFSLRLTENDVADAQVLVAATFTVIAGTVAFSGVLARPIANRLALVDDQRRLTVILGSNKVARSLATVLAEHDFEVAMVGMDRRNLATARMEGLLTHYGSVLEEDTWEEVGVGDAGVFLAMSSQDEVNTLASRRAAQLLGRRNVFQIVPHRRRRGRTSVPNASFGRPLFAPGATIEKLDARMDDGWQVTATKLTDAFTPKDYFREHRAAMVLAAIRHGGLHVHDAGRRMNLRAGDVVVSLLPPSDRESRDTRRRERGARADKAADRGSPRTTPT